MRALRVTIAALISLAAPPGCSDDCKSLPPSFQLDILSASGAASIDVSVRLGAEERVGTIDLGGALDDGETSLVVELDPVITADFELDVGVSAYSELGGVGPIVGSAEQHFMGTPDGCNHFSLELAPPIDGGCNDTCTDPSCNLSCSGGCSACQLSCIGATECETSCTGSSTCEIECRDTATCNARCLGNASCRMVCLNAGACSFLTCDRPQMMCADGSIVCNRSCP